MSVELSPSIRMLVLVVTVLLIGVLWVYSSGALTTLLLLIVVVGGTVALLYLGGWRIVRRLVGM